MQGGTSDNVIVKFNWQEDVRRETMPAPLTFAGLEASARAAYELAPPLLLTFKYKDQDGDLITVACDRDLEEAVKESKGRLYLHVFTSGNSTTTQSERGPQEAPKQTSASQSEQQQSTQPTGSGAGQPPLDIPSLLQTFGPMLGIAPQLQQGILGNPQMMQLIQTAMQNPALLNLATQFLSSGMLQPSSNQGGGQQQQPACPFPFPFAMNAGPGSGPFNFACGQQREETAAPAVDQRLEAECLEQLGAMGFGDQERSRRLLRQHGYDLTRTIQDLTREDSSSS